MCFVLFVVFVEPDVVVLLYIAVDNETVVVEEKDVVDGNVVTVVVDNNFVVVVVQLDFVQICKQQVWLLFFCSLSSTC